MGWNKIKIDQADRIFSRYIRYRDKWTCQRCGRKHPEGAGTLGNSHYWSRRHESTRFDPENCDAICNAPCHQMWGGDYREDYKKFKLKQLGNKGYDLLELRHNQYQKKDRKLALMIAKALLKEVCPS